MRNRDWLIFNDTAEEIEEPGNSDGFVWYWRMLPVIGDQWRYWGLFRRVLLSISIIDRHLKMLKRPHWRIRLIRWAVTWPIHDDPIDLCRCSFHTFSSRFHHLGGQCPLVPHFVHVVRYRLFHWNTLHHKSFCRFWVISWIVYRLFSVSRSAALHVLRHAVLDFCLFVLSLDFGYRFSRLPPHTASAILFLTAALTSASGFCVHVSLTHRSWTSSLLTWVPHVLQLVLSSHTFGGCLESLTTVPLPHLTRPPPAAILWEASHHLTQEMGEAPDCNNEESIEEIILTGIEMKPSGEADGIVIDDPMLWPEKCSKLMISVIIVDIVDDVASMVMAAIRW